MVLTRCFFCPADLADLAPDRDADADPVFVKNTAVTSFRMTVTMFPQDSLFSKNFWPA
jgi:hypothetical protein